MIIFIIRDQVITSTIAAEPAIVGMTITGVTGKGAVAMAAVAITGAVIPTGARRPGARTGMMAVAIGIVRAGRVTIAPTVAIATGPAGRAAIGPIVAIATARAVIVRVGATMTVAGGAIVVRAPSSHGRKAAPHVRLHGPKPVNRVRHGRRFSSRRAAISRSGGVAMAAAGGNAADVRGPLTGKADQMA